MPFSGHGNGMHAGSVSPLHQRMNAGSVSPLRQRMRAGSVSPLHQRKLDHRYDSDYEHPVGLHHGPGYKGGRGRGRFREFSPPPPYGQGRAGRSFGRGFRSFDGPEQETSPSRGDPVGRNNPNISPREGDWICSEPSCGNLNFARRSYCNNCNKLRFAPRGNGPGGSPRRSFFRPPSPHAPMQRFSGPPMERGKGRDTNMNGYGSPRGWVNGAPREPLHNWGRDEPRDFKVDPPPRRHVERFSGDHLRRERPPYPEDGYRGRGKFDRSMLREWGHRGRGRSDFFNDRRWYDGNDRWLPSPPLSPHRGPWVNDRRDRSRSPIRGALRDYGREPFLGRGRDYQRGMGRGKRFYGEY